MLSGNAKSHIQMPRFLLARFDNEHHSFYYYDVEKDHIGINGYAKSMNTEFGYYPIEIEEFLSNEIEQPFSRILRLIDSVDLNEKTFTPSKTDINIIKLFICSLIARNPIFLNGLKNSGFFELFNRIDQHTFAVLEGITKSQEIGLLDDFCVTLTINKSTKPFILPISGIYDYQLNGYLHFNLPISPEVAITLIKSAEISSFDNKSTMRPYLITEERHIIKLNSYAFQQQCIQGYGYVISPTKNALEEQRQQSKQSR